MSRPRVIRVKEASGVGEARREALILAQRLGFNETDAGKVSIVVTEAAANMVKHANGGQIVLRELVETDVSGLEILAIDKGPGMHSVEKCMEDGYSTAGSPGTGLGAIMRMASFVQIYSQPNAGTILLAQFLGKKPKKHSTDLTVGVVCAPMHDNEPCGDSWSIRKDGEWLRILVVDGLGHGPLAASAADEAVRIFQSSKAGSGPQLIQDMHLALRSTRGASLAVAGIDEAESQVRYTGVGNITAQVWTAGASRSMVSHNGIVGHEMRVVREFVYPWTSASTLMMHSDGIVSRWSLDAYPGLTARHPSVIAAVLYRDFARGRDDVTSLVARPKAACSTWA